MLLADLDYDVRTLASADDKHLTRMILTREYDLGEQGYAERLPTVQVEAVVPAYQTVDRAIAEFGVRTRGYGPDPSPSASLLRWEMLVPEDADWSDEEALRRAAELARRDDFRDKREEMRAWWRDEVLRKRPPPAALTELLERADRLNKIISKRFKATRSLNGLAWFGGLVSTGGAWFPPVAFAGGSLSAVGIGGKWALDELERRLAPSAMITDARRHFNWHNSNPSQTGGSP